MYGATATATTVLFSAFQKTYPDDIPTLIDTLVKFYNTVADFRKSAYRYAYHRQAAFYLDGFNAKEFIFVVIESNAPHQIGIFRCSEHFIEQGRQEYIELLEKKNKYCQTVVEANNHIIHDEL